MKPWLKHLCLLAVSLTLAGCAASKTQSPRPPFPVNVAQPCPPVPAFDSQHWDALATAYMELVFMYGQCSAKHDAAVTAYEDKKAAP